MNWEANMEVSRYLEYAYTLQRMADDYRRRGMHKEAHDLDYDTVTFCTKNGIEPPHTLVGEAA